MDVDGSPEDTHYSRNIHPIVLYVKVAAEYQGYVGQDDRRAQVKEGSQSMVCEVLGVTNIKNMLSMNLKMCQNEVGERVFVPESDH